jgi:two-component system, sensor histidine kinase ChiS
MGTVTGRVLIIGRRAAALAPRLESRGFICESTPRLSSERRTWGVDAVVIAGSARTAESALEAVRKHPSLKSVPVLVDGSQSPKAFGHLGVDAIAGDLEELERQLAASLRARRLTDRDVLVRHRLELLLEVSRSAAQGVPVAEIIAPVVRRLEEALGCDQVSALQVEGVGRKKAWLVDAGGGRTPVELAVSPALTAALEKRGPVASDGSWIDPFPTQSEGLAALILRRDEPLEQEERDFLEAVGHALFSALERERRHAAIDQTRDALERAYVDRYKELVDANNRLKAIDRKKNELLAVLSHDLRAPLNVLLGHSHLLVTDRSLDASAKASAEAIQRTSRKMLELIENLLDQSRGQERTVLFTRALDVAETCQEVVRDLQILARQRGVQLRAEAPMTLMVLGDEQKIRQVLQNLLTNALTHADQATEVVLRARLKPRPDGDVALVEVKDDGKVADPNALLLAFERSRGLGLAICREYVERHGGEIWAEAPSEGGALFVFTLPIRQEQTVRSVSRSVDAPLILLAEDDPVFLRVASMGLSGHYRVETARDGEQAVERAKALTPDVIVMDVFMPRRDGLDALRELKADARTRDIPVLLISGNLELTDKIRSIDVGAVDHLTKPFPLSTLLTRVTEAIQRSSRSMTASGPGNDPETGLFDHLGIVNRLSQELSRSGRYARPLTIAVLKPLTPPNDRVRTCAAVIRKELRSPDVVGHLGGGVLALILPETAPEEAPPLVARLCELLESASVPYRSKVAGVTDLGKGPDAILEQVLA